MLDITQISAVVAAAGVLIGVIYYILDMRHQRQVRQTDLIMRLYSTFSSGNFKMRGTNSEISSSRSSLTYMIMRKNMVVSKKSIRCVCFLKESEFFFKEDSLTSV